MGKLAFHCQTSITSSYSLLINSDEKTEVKKRKQQRNYDKLEHFRTGELLTLVKKLVQKNEKIRSIKDNYINPFEKMDNDYRKKINKIYNDCTSFTDKFSNFGAFIESITNAFIEKFVIAFAIALVVALVPGGIFLAGILIVGTGCVVMTAVPEEYVPEWMTGAKKAAEGVTEKAVTYLTDPTVMIEDIGQGLMDTVQTPEGVAGLSGELIGGFAGAKVGMAAKTQVRAPKCQVEGVIEEIPRNIGGAKNVVGHEKYKRVLKTTEDAKLLVNSLKETRKLPDSYITKATARENRWKPGKALENYASGKQIGGDIFQNMDDLLPNANSRIWYEADIGLSGVMSRSKQAGTRLMYSNDGLMYVTTDHYKTFHYIGKY